MKYNVAHFGAFDIDSLGDSLFVTIMKNELSSRLDIENYTLFSLNHVDNAFNNNGIVYSYEEFDKINNAIHFDALIIGGGELLHYKPISFNKNSLNNVNCFYEAGKLWRFPANKGKKLNIPVIFNCAGVPYNIPEEYYKDFAKTLNGLSYMSVRDYYSAVRIKDFFDDKALVHTIPDTVFNIDLVYSKEKLLSHFQNLKLDNSFNKSEKYICIQYGTSYRIDDLVNQIKQIRSSYNYQIVLLPINYCHEDVSSMNYIKEKLQDDKVFLFDNLNPIDIISIISNASLFAGTSFHGNLIAFTYNVKCIAFDMYNTFISKIDGLFNYLNLFQYILPEPNSLFSTFSEINNDDTYVSLSQNKNAETKNILKKHFDEIADIIKQNTTTTIHTILNVNVPNFAHFKKAFIKYKKDDNTVLKYIISESLDNIYKFTFNNINASELSFNFFSDNPCSVEILSFIVNDSVSQFSNNNSLRQNNDESLFADYIVSYNLTSSDIIKELKVECIIKELNKDTSLELLKENMRNKDAHIEHLMQSERDLQYKNSCLSKDIKNLKEQNNSLELQINSIRLNFKNMRNCIRNRIFKHKN